MILKQSVFVVVIALISTLASCQDAVIQPAGQATNPIASIISNSAVSVNSTVSVNSSSEVATPVARITTVVIVFSQLENFELRQAIRETWGRKDVMKAANAYGPYFFIVGVPRCVQGENSSNINRVQKELIRHWDILSYQGEEDYRFRADKATLMMEWIFQQHSLGFFGKPGIQRLYVLKVNDDVYANVGAAVAAFQATEQERGDRKNFLFCPVVDNEKVDRDVNSRFYVSKEMFQADVFPRHCFRAGYMFSGSTHRELRCVTSKLQPFPLEEVFVSLIMADRAKTDVVPMPENQVKLMLDERDNKNIRHEIEQLCKISASTPAQILIHPVTPYDMQMVHACTAVAEQCRWDKSVKKAT